MIEGKIPVWTQIAAKDFLANLIGILKTREIPDVQIKILYLIQKWGKRFEIHKEILPNFTEVYSNLKKQGVSFPENFQPGYIKYVKEEENVEEKINNFNNNYSNDFSKNNFENSKGNYQTNIQLDLNPNNFDNKYTKLIDKISLWIQNINLANEMIDNADVKMPIDDGLKYVIESLITTENELIICIQEKVKDEKLLEILLALNDDIIRTKTRYDLVKAKKKPDRFTSVFLDDKYSSSNIYNSNEKNIKDVQIQNNQPKNNNLLDLFQLENITNTNKKVVNSENVQRGNEKANEIFDIFNQNPITQKTSPLERFNNTENKNTIITSNMINQQALNEPINEKKNPVDLFEKLKMAYNNEGQNNNLEIPNRNPIYNMTGVGISGPNQNVMALNFNNNNPQNNLSNLNPGILANSMSNNMYPLINNANNNPINYPSFDSINTNTSIQMNLQQLQLNKNNEQNKPNISFPF